MPRHRFFKNNMHVIQPKNSIFGIPQTTDKIYIASSHFKKSACRQSSSSSCRRSSFLNNDPPEMDPMTSYNAHLSAVASLIEAAHHYLSAFRAMPTPAGFDILRVTLSRALDETVEARAEMLEQPLQVEAPPRPLSPVEEPGSPKYPPLGDVLQASGGPPQVVVSSTKPMSKKRPTDLQTNAPAATAPLPPALLRKPALRIHSGMVLHPRTPPVPRDTAPKSEGDFGSAKAREFRRVSHPTSVLARRDDQSSHSGGQSRPQIPFSQMEDPSDSYLMDSDMPETSTSSAYETLEK